MSYTPDCGDCPTPTECKAKNDCQVMRQIRHGHERHDDKNEPVQLDRSFWRAQGIEACLDRMQLMGDQLHALRSASGAMNEVRATEILKKEVQGDGGLYSLGWYLAWTPGDLDATLDGQFTADDLEAIAWWIRNKRKA
jgi:hypothetical protein